MAPSEEELRSLLMEVGSKLKKPPTSVKELLALLDRVEVYLSCVEQSPSKKIQNALAPTFKALVGDELLRHGDDDVKVSVASCISEITRITAPEVPYEDDQMKEVFQLIVSTFENLADKSSKSYIKRTSILETVAKVRSCVVMLDLEFDGLILEMFRHFIKAIRDYHLEDVFIYMESIMTRVIEESEEISSDLLFCILDTVKKGNKEVTSTAHKLMVNVIEACANKLKPYVEIAMRNKLVSLAEYDEVVSLICKEASAETIVQSEKTTTSLIEVHTESNEPAQPAETIVRSEITSLVEVRPESNEPAQPAAVAIKTPEETPPVAANSIEKPPADGCSELVTSNGNLDVEAYKLSDSSMLQETKSCYAEKASGTVTAGLSAAVSNSDGPGVEADMRAPETSIENPQAKDGDLVVEKVDEGESRTEPKAEKNLKMRGRKTKAKNKTSDPKLAVDSNSSAQKSDEITELPELSESLNSNNEDKCPSPPQESSNEAAEHSLPNLADTVDVPSEDIVGELEEKLNGLSEGKTLVSNSENHTSLDEKAVGDLEGETAVLTVDPSEVEPSVSAVDAPVDKPIAPDDENREDTTVPVSNAAEDVAAVDEQMLDMESSAGKSPVDKPIAPDDKNLEDTTVPVSNAAEEVAAVDEQMVDMESSGGKSPVDKPIAPDDKNLEDTIVPVSNAAEDVDAVDEQMVDMESSAGKSPEVEDGLSKTNDIIKKRGRGKGKATLQKLAAQSAAGNKNKESNMTQKSASKPMKDEEKSRDSSKTSSKRKRVEEDNNESKEYGEDLVGSGVKVWWPDDKRFYKGVIESFDSVKKKHKVLYADGEVEILFLKSERWELIKPDEDSDTEGEAEQKTPNVVSDKRQKAKEVVGSTTKKRLGRPPSNKSNSASNKPGRKPKDHDKSDSKSGDNSKAGAKGKTDGSKDEGKSKEESVKKPGRPRADGSNSTSKLTADEPSSSANGKSKAAKSAAEEAKSSGKPKVGDSKISNKGKSDSKTASKPETSSAKQNDAKGKGTKSSDENIVVKDNAKTASAARNKGKSTKATHKSDVKAPEKVDSVPYDSEETEDDVEEETPTTAKGIGGSSKRKASLLEKGNKSGAKPAQKRNQGPKQ